MTVGAYRPAVGDVMLTIGSCAAEPRESGQVRKEAALSGSFRVTQGHLVRVGNRQHHWTLRFKDGGTILKRQSTFAIPLVFIS